MTKRSCFERATPWRPLGSGVLLKSRLDRYVESFRDGIYPPGATAVPTESMNHPRAAPLMLQVDGHASAAADLCALICWSRCVAVRRPRCHNSRMEPRV